MARTLLCEIVTPERIVYTNEVDMVVAPATDGEIGVLPLHAPIVTSLGTGEVRVKHGDKREWFAISGGFMQVHEDKVIILADRAVASGQIDLERASQAKILAEKRLQELSGSDDVERDACLTDLRWCEIQEKVAGKAE